MLFGCQPDGSLDFDGGGGDDAGDNLLPDPSTDGGMRPPRDLSHAMVPPGSDLAVPPEAMVDMARPPFVGTGVNPRGGSVNLLHFGVAGDTRPPSCDDTPNYPTAVINAIAGQLKGRQAQFAIDLGDHMYVCNDDLPTALAQMKLYMNAVNLFGGTWFMTQGNHECWKGPCLPGSQNANYVAFMKALAPISNSPYYTFDVLTSLGLVTFVIVADNSWSNAQASWLDKTLATADQKAAYTIVARHHPEGDSSVLTNADSIQIIRVHKFALLLTGHDHLYKHMVQTDGGRDLVLGNAGAPLIAGGSFSGYGMIDQQNDGKLQVTIYDVANNNAPVDTWSVGPNH